MKFSPARRPLPRSLFAAALLLGACQAVAPTIANRQGRKGPAPENVHLSLGDQYPSELPGPAPERSVDGVAPPAYVQPVVGGDERLQVEFRDAPLGQVIHFLADRAGINIYLDAEATERVDVSFKSITLDDALHALLARNGRRLVESPPGVFWIERNDGSQAAVRSFTAHSISAETVLANLRALVAASTTVIVEPTQNLIVVRGTQADIDLVSDYLARADRTQRQVLIEVRILEVVLGDDFQLGVTHDIAGTVNGHLFGLMQQLGADDESFQFQFNSQDGDIDATITAIRRLTGTDLVSSPRILALTGAEATIEVIREVPYINVTNTQTASANGQGVNVVQEVQFKEAGVKLKVTPTIQDDDAVRIAIDQELSEVVDTFNQIPVLDKRFLKSSFLVQDRSTVVLGGLMQNKRTQIDKGIPGLMDIPWVGRLFRSDEDVDQKRELLVFLTPRIVRPEEAATLNGVFRREYSERIRQTGVSSHADPRTR
jgi:type II secretory pathway component GspD/PulD (secretin)